MKLFRKRSLRSAFTIVELLIAVSVMGILAGVAVPRYNTVMRQIEYDKSVQLIVECLQTAQNYAANPGLNAKANIRYVAVKLYNNSGTLECHTGSVPYTRANAFSTFALLYPGSDDFAFTSLTGVTLTNIISNADILSDSVLSCSKLPTTKNLNLYFGVEEHGALMRVEESNYATDCSPSYTLNDYFTQKVDLQFDVTQTAIDTQIKDRTIKINPTGTPIQIVL